MANLTLKIVLPDSPTYLPYELARGIVRAMRSADHDMARLALSLIGNLTVSDSPVIASMIDPVYKTYAKDTKDHKAGTRYMDKRAMLESAYDLDPADLLILIDNAETSMKRWIASQTIERESSAQVKDRAINRQTKNESADSVIAGSDIPSLVNKVARKISLRPASGKHASYDSLFGDMTESELIAAYRAFDSIPLIDDTRRLASYRTALKAHNLSLQDVIDMWEKIDNPPKQATPKKATPRKATPTEKPNRTAAKATPASEDSDDPDMIEYMEFQKFKAMKARANKA